MRRLRDDWRWRRCIIRHRRVRCMAHRLRSGCGRSRRETGRSSTYIPACVWTMVVALAAHRTSGTTGIPAHARRLWSWKVSFPSRHLVNNRRKGIPFSFVEFRIFRNVLDLLFQLRNGDRSFNLLLFPSLPESCTGSRVALSFLISDS